MPSLQHLVVLFVAITAVNAGPLAPRKQLTRRAGKTTGKYIVGLNAGKSTKDVLRSSTVTVADHQVKTEWKNLNAFVVEANETTAETLLSHDDVKYVEEEGYVGLDVVQHDATWGLSRLSSSGQLTSNDTLALSYDYTYEDSAGEGVDAYIIDTGIRLTHEQFQGRASWGASFPDSLGQGDGYGHGTHVAGTVAGSQFGVAKAAHLIAVRVLDDTGNGVASQCLSGMDWVISAVQASGNPSIASISLHYDPSDVFDDAVKALTDAGIHVVVSAGNNNLDASSQSPARAPEAITVGAITIDDEKWAMSNFGPLVDIWAPGVDITSAYILSDTSTLVATGTSMSTPHITGLVAYLIAKDGNLAPADMSTKLKSLSQKGLVSGVDSDTINAIAHNGE